MRADLLRVRGDRDHRGRREEVDAGLAGETETGVGLAREIGGALQTLARDAIPDDDKPPGLEVSGGGCPARRFEEEGHGVLA